MHAVADYLDQAIEDITHDRSVERNQQWISRTAQPGIDPTLGVLPADLAAKQAWLAAVLAALDRLGRPSVRGDLSATRNDVDWLRGTRQDLDRGTARWAPLRS